MECSQSKEDRIQLVLYTFRNGQFKKKSVSFSIWCLKLPSTAILQDVASCSEKATNY